MLRKFKLLVSLFVALNGGAALMLAQTTTATITGVVTDPSGAMITTAEIVVTNVGTGAKRAVQSNSAGRYLVAQLSPGSYEVDVTAQGFETTLRRGITLQVGQEATLNFALRVGNVAEQVTVTEEAPLVDTNTSAVAGVVEERRITELPLNGRDFTQLALVQPGVVSLRSTNAVSQKGFGTRISIAGVRPDQTLWLLDGTNIKSFSNFGSPGNAANVMLGVDAVREFQVLTSTYGAEFGASSGGVISLVTKSGTNEIHGTAYEFLRNDNFDARNFFDATKKPEFKRNQFGVSIGGPVIKDKLFYFGNYEGLRQRRGTSNTAFVPDENARRGILPTAGGGTEQLAVASSVRGFLDIYPLPNGPSIGGGSARLFTLVNEPTRDDYFMTRVDYRLDDDQTLFARFTLDQSSRTTPALVPVWQNVVSVPTRYALVQYDYVVTPRFLSNSRIAYNRTRIGSAAEYLVEYPQQLYTFSPERPPEIGYTGGTNLGAGINETFNTVQNLYEFGQSFLYTLGAQTWKFGFNYTKPDLNARASSKRSGTMTWASLRDFLLDRPLEALEVGVPGTTTERTVRQSVYAAYVQNDWKVRSNLSLNLGVRYETFTSPSEKWGRMSTVLDWTTASAYDFGPDIRFWKNNSKKNFSPRVGFAWDSAGDGRTAIRGGFGIFYTLMTGFFYRSAVVKNPPFAANLELPLGNNLASAPGYVAAAGPARLSPAMTPTTTWDAYEYNQNPQYDMKLNLTVQRDLGNNLAVTVGYLGGRSIHLWNQKHANSFLPTMRDGRPFVAAGSPRLNPRTGPGLLRDADAQSFYNALQLEVKKRLSQNFQFQAAYTFSKTIDDSTTGVASSDFLEGPGSQPYDSKADRGLSALHVGQNLVINGLAYLPSPVESGFASYLLKGWQVSSIFSASSGTPLTAHTSGRNAPDGSASAGRQRPDLAPGRTFDSLVVGDPNGWFDTSAFLLPDAGFYGNAGRNIIPGPGVMTVDISLMKNTPLSGERQRLEFRADFFNLTNRPNFANPGTAVMRVWNAGNRRPIEGAGIISNTTTSSRQMQFGLKYIF